VEHRLATGEPVKDRSGHELTPGGRAPHEDYRCGKKSRGLDQQASHELSLGGRA
jgi:hypothetical protein